MIAGHCSTNPHSHQWLKALSSVTSRLSHIPLFSDSGKIVRATGLVLEAVGIKLPLGSSCLIEITEQGRQPSERFAEAEVVGFGADRLFLMPLTELSGLVPGAAVYPIDSDDGHGGRRYPSGLCMLGRVVDGYGNPLDGRGSLGDCNYSSAKSPPINPLSRQPICRQIDVGIRAINALISVGGGQRMGLFAGSGVGKSVLLGMMARYTSADVIIVGLIGERGREVKEFIDRILGHEGMKRAIVVAAPADHSPLQRLHGAAYATRLAEDFRDRGCNVLLIMDSLTRYAMAQREIALAVGEPPATKGYPPSVFAKLPALVERAGNGAEGSGSITAFYTVLTEGDDQQDPIADAARAILDGHIVLSRGLAEAGHYPAIDIEASVSRAIDNIISERQYRQTLALKQLFSVYQRNRDLISVGAYSPGHDARLDAAVKLYPKVEAFLQQGISEKASIEESARALANLIGDGK